MTLEQAIKRARGRVAIVPQGRDYVLHTWSPSANATFVSHSMDYWHARAYAKEVKIREALELLGVEDAGYEANMAAEDEGRWDDILRRTIKRLRHGRQ